MRRHFLQRWSVVFLLVSRLIFGELAYSAPHDMPAQPVPAASSEQQPCVDHEGEQAAVAHALESESGVQDADAIHDKDCCKATACECACVHISALAPSLTVTLILIHLDRVPTFAPGLAQQRPSGLFRPPA